MKLQNCNLEEFVKIIQNRNVFCFGAAGMMHEILDEYAEIHLEERVSFLVDNNLDKWGKKYSLGNKEIQIISPDELLKKIKKNDILLITSGHYVEIFEQLCQLPELDNIDCFIWPAVAPQYKSDNLLKEKIKKLEYKEELIPKKIHYFWFGKGAMPELERRCVASWKRVCPDCEIIRWDETNYDITQNRYMFEAYQAKKWGFVTDYARLDIIYKYGGICLDTDVELRTSFDDLLKLKGFAGFESKTLIGLGLGFGAKAGHPMIKEFMLDYIDRPFRLTNGDLDLTPCPVIQTKTLKKHGILLNNQIQVINDMVFLPAECFSPDNHLIPHITPNTYSVHHFSGSWTSMKNRNSLNEKRVFFNLMLQDSNKE